MAKRTASARKQMRAAVGRTIRNKSVRSAVKTRVVRVRKAIAEHTEGLAEVAVAAISSLDRAANKGILHANNAGRRKSRLMKALNQAEKAPATAEAKATAKPKAVAGKPKAVAGKPKTAAKGSAKPAAKAAKAKAPTTGASSRPAPKAKAAARKK